MCTSRAACPQMHDYGGRTRWGAGWDPPEEYAADRLVIPLTVGTEGYSSDPDVATTKTTDEGTVGDVADPSRSVIGSR
jgi:hypothetical protein